MEPNSIRILIQSQLQPTQAPTLDQQLLRAEELVRIIRTTTITELTILDQTFMVIVDQDLLPVEERDLRQAVLIHLDQVLTAEAEAEAVALAHQVQHLGEDNINETY